MNWQKVIAAADWDRLTAKATKDKTAADDMLNFIVNNYLAAVKRDAGADVDSNIAKKLAGMTDVEKAALAVSIGA